jgi:hypothetical protein
MGREEGVESEAPLRRNLIAMGMGQFLNNAMGSQQTELATDGNGTATSSISRVPWPSTRAFPWRITTTRFFWWPWDGRSKA